MSSTFSLRKVIDALIADGNSSSRSSLREMADRLTPGCAQQTEGFPIEGNRVIGTTEYDFSATRQRHCQARYLRGKRPCLIYPIRRALLDPTAIPKARNIGVIGAVGSLLPSREFLSSEPQQALE